MNNHPYNRTLLIGLFTLVFILIGSLKNLNAQFVEKWLAVGDYHHRYSSAGSRDYADWQSKMGMNYPGVYDRTGHFACQAMWITTTNWNSGETEQPPKTYEIKTVHRGPREPGYGQYFGMDLDVISKFEPPKVFVDGLETFKRPVSNDEVDPDMKADRMVYNRVNSAIGVTMERWIRQFSNEYHDNYHIIEYKFTNTGNVDDDETVKLPDQTLEGVRITWINNFVHTLKASGLPAGTAWGRNTMNDVVGDGNKTYDIDIRAVYSWAGHFPPFDKWNTVGAPQITNQGWHTAQADSIGRLAGSSFMGRATLHADTGPADSSDDPNQPSTTTYLDGDDKLTSTNSQFDEAQMHEEFERVVAAGNVAPMHADVVEPPPAANAPDPDNPGTFDPVEWRTRFANQYNRPDFITAGGFNNVVGYGPYTLGPEESVSFVVVEGADGLSWNKNYVIGRAYKQAWEQYGHPDADTVKINYDGSSLTKNEWVLTGRDSLMEMIKAAEANWESGYTIPEPPRPPREFLVSSRPGKIELDWQTYEGANDPEGGWEIYRARTSIDSTFNEIASLPGSDRHYDDETAVRGIEYYYYIQAVGPEVTDNITFDPPKTLRLRSSRYYTQTYAPASLRRAAGTALNQVRVVPNPYNLAADRSIRWPDKQDKLGFLNIPGQCTIRIYTEAGELIQTIEHTDGSGDEYWGMTTSSNQLAVSGIYLAIIEDQETGEQIIRKFSIIR